MQCFLVILHLIHCYQKIHSQRTTEKRNLVNFSNRVFTLLLATSAFRDDTTERLHFHFSLSCIGEGNGNPLQCSCLENPRGGGAWWAAVYGVAQSRTRLKRLSSSSSSSIQGSQSLHARAVGHGSNSQAEPLTLASSEIQRGKARYKTILNTYAFS